jgi:hypothetical protein
LNLLGGMIVEIRIQLANQLNEIETRLKNVDDFKEWAILQNAKALVLTAMQKYENRMS